MSKKWRKLFVAFILLFGMWNGAVAAASVPDGLRDAKHLPYGYIGSLKDGYAYFCNYGRDGDGLCGFIDSEGNIAVPAKYDGIDSFAEGLAPVSIDEKWGFVDAKGHEVIPPAYDNVSQFSEGLAAVERDGAWGYIDKTGKVVIPFTYE